MVLSVNAPAQEAGMGGHGSGGGHSCGIGGGHPSGFGGGHQVRSAATMASTGTTSTAGCTHDRFRFGVAPVFPYHGYDPYYGYYPYDARAHWYGASYPNVSSCLTRGCQYRLHDACHVWPR
jgi:hypothetical protein